MGMRPQDEYRALYLLAEGATWVAIRNKVPIFRAMKAASHLTSLATVTKEVTALLVRMRLVEPGLPVGGPTIDELRNAARLWVACREADRRFQSMRWEEIRAYAEERL
jgi:hypothetical protein